LSELIEGRIGLGSVGWDILGFLVKELVLDLGSMVPDALLPELGDLNHFEGFDNKPESPEGEEERGKLKRPEAGCLENGLASSGSFGIAGSVWLAWSFVGRRKGESSLVE
jgi:hypothetical protein